MPLLTRKYLLLAKIEANYGVDPIPTADLNAILVENLKFKPNPEILDRGNVALPDLSKLPHLIGKLSGDISFDAEIAGQRRRRRRRAAGYRAHIAGLLDGGIHHGRPRRQRHLCAGERQPGVGGALLLPGRALAEIPGLRGRFEAGGTGRQTRQVFLHHEGHLGRGCGCPDGRADLPKLPPAPAQGRHLLIWRLVAAPSPNWSWP